MTGFLYYTKSRLVEPNGIRIREAELEVSSANGESDYGPEPLNPDS